MDQIDLTQEDEGEMSGEDGEESVQDDQDQKQLISADIDDVPDTREIIQSATNFRFSAQQVFLTYANASLLTKQLIYDTINSKYPVKCYIIGQEMHRSGQYHFHAYFKFMKKVHLRLANAFDINGHHPNIRACSKNPKGAIEYAMKDGDFVSDGCTLFPNSTNYIKRKTDLQAWLHDRQHQAQPVKWPITLPDQSILLQPTHDFKRAEKLRHVWIYGEANTGKTYWVNEQFNGQEVFMRPNTGFDLPFDAYNGQQVIIYDDCDIMTDQIRWASELKVITNINTTPIQVPGRTRNVVRWLKTNQARTVIILSNYSPPWLDESWFQSRFRVIHMRNQRDQADDDAKLLAELANLERNRMANSEEPRLAPISVPSPNHSEQSDHESSYVSPTPIQSNASPINRSGSPDDDDGHGIRASSPPTPPPRLRRSYAISTKLPESTYNQLERARRLKRYKMRPEDPYEKGYESDPYDHN